MKKLFSLLNKPISYGQLIAGILLFTLMFAVTGFTFAQRISEEFTARYFNHLVVTVDPSKNPPNDYVRDFYKSDGLHWLDENGVVVDNIDSKATKLFQNGANGQKLTIQSATTTLSALSGGTATATNLIPAGSVVLGVTVRVTTLITGATSIDIGDGSDADRWGNDIAVALNTTTSGSDITITSVPIYAAATSVVLTANGSNFTAGAARITVHYISVAGPTS